MRRRRAISETLPLFSKDPNVQLTHCHQNNRNEFQEKSMHDKDKDKDKAKGKDKTS